MRTFILPLVFALLGFIFSTRVWIKNYDRLPPYGGLIVYYIVLTITLILLEKAGLIIGGIEFSGFSHTLGTMLIVFSFFIIFNWESCYINVVTKGKCDEKDISNVYFASEDGAVYDLWNRIFKGRDELNRVLTYILTPLILSFIGMTLLSPEEKVKITI